MDFLKKHYEKLLLGLVLLGLMVAVGFLLMKIGSEKQKLEELANSLTHPKVQALTNLDLSIQEASLKRMSTPVALDLSGTNRLFNPMPWQQTRDVPPKLIPGNKVGPTLAIVTNIVPLQLKISLDSVNVVEGGPPRYVIGVEKESAPTADKRRKSQKYCSVGDKNETFQLLGVGGPPDNPTNVVIVLMDTSETNRVSKDVPFKRVDGYKADIAYTPEKRFWRDKRVGDSVAFNNEDYKIVAINQNEVILQAKSNEKKWTIKFNPTA